MRRVEDTLNRMVRALGPPQALLWDYDRTRALADGAVKIKGVEGAFHSARIVMEIFEAMIRQR